MEAALLYLKLLGPPPASPPAPRKTYKATVTPNYLCYMMKHRANECFMELSTLGLIIELFFSPEKFMAGVKEVTEKVFKVFFDALLVF